MFRVKYFLLASCLLVAGLAIIPSQDSMDSMRFRRRKEGRWQPPGSGGASDGVVGCSTNILSSPKPQQPQTLDLGGGKSFAFPECQNVAADQRKSCVEKAFDDLAPLLAASQAQFTNLMLELTSTINQVLGQSASVKLSELAKNPDLQLAHLVVVNPKGKSRSVSKVVAPAALDGYSGDMRKLTDVLRSTIIFRDHDSLAQAVCLIRKKNTDKSLGFTLVRESDGLKGTDPSGYMDYKLIISLGTGKPLAEVQLLSCSLFYAKMALPGRNGHAIYEASRATDDATKKKALLDESRSLYALYTPPNGAKFREGTVHCGDAVGESDRFVIAWDEADPK